MSSRKTVIGRDGIALAELLDGDLEALGAGGDGAFDVDPDGRPTVAYVDAYRLVVVDEESGELLGQVNWHAVSYGRSAASEAWNIGRVLLPAARGRGVGTAALRLLVEHLFATTGVDRIEAGTEVSNLAARRSLGRVGFRAEGLVRGAVIRDGQRRDHLRYGLLRMDFEAVAGDRVIVAQRDGIALTEVLTGDRAEVFDRCTSEFDLDEDRREVPAWPVSSSWLTIVADGVPVGGISYRIVSYGGTVGNLAWNFGIGLLPEARGRGVGPAAQRLLVEHLFDTTELDRIEATTDVDNVAEQRALEKSGFRREGVARGAQLRGGVRRDVVHYGLLRSEMP